MRRIEVDNGNDDNRKKGMPLGGWIWRYLLFLVLLFLFLILLKWLLSRPSSSDYDPDFVEHTGLEIPDDPTYFNDLPDDDVNGIEIFNKNGNTDEDIFSDPDRLRNLEYPISPDDGINPDIYRTNPELRDILTEPLPGDGGNFNNPIKELPAPNDNWIDPINPDDLINPDGDPYREIDGTSIGVILDDNSQENFEGFVKRVKSLYPGDDVKVNYYNPEAGLIQLKVSPRIREDVKSRIRSNIKDIKYKLFDDLRFNRTSTAADYNDPAFKNSKRSWHFGPIQAYDAWDITQGSNDIVVAVIDSYIDITHPELKGRIVKPYSVERKSRNVLPPSVTYSFGRDGDAPIYHGTHVAALAVGALNNNNGAAGLAPNCKLMPISLGQNMSSMAILEGMLYAINQGADVINLSLATVFPPGTDKAPINDQLNYINNVNKYHQEVWDYVFDLADKKNCTIVWAAGNCNVLSGMDETKRGKNTIRVSAVGPDLKKADFSNYGNYTSQNINYSNVSAPGVDIYSAGPGNAYGFCPGTSMAAPIVAGAVALMKSVNPNLTNAQIINILDKTGKEVDRNGHIGKLIQVRDALKMAGADVANYDEIKENPNNIKGMWQTTQEIPVVDTQTNMPTGEMTHIFLDFTSINSGRIYYKTDGGCLYSTSFKGQFDGNKLVINQDNFATSSSCGKPFAPVRIECTRGENGRLKCRSYYDGEGGEYYYLVRSNVKF